MDKIFTPREADTLIPKLEAIFQHMETCQKRTQELAATRPAPSAKPSTAEVADAARIRSQIEFLLQAIQEDITMITHLGAVVKDLDMGLVDFPGRVEGNDVWLCWKRGERKIRFWHSLDAGYTERQMLKRSENRTGTTH
jgi:hypothetical protein